MDPEFPFDDIVLLPIAAMSDDEFRQYMKFVDIEIPIEDVDFPFKNLDLPHINGGKL